MKSTRITKQNKLRKNSKLKKRFIRGGSKKGNKKHVKRSIEKKSRKMRGSGETVERKNEGYESETVKLKLFKNIIKKIIGLLEINTNAIEEIKDALSRLSSLSTEDLSNLQAELEKLNDIYQPSYKELNQGKIYATVKRPPLPPPRRPRLRINCSIRSNQECIEFDGCELVQKKNRGRFGLFRTINTCVEKKTPAA